MANTVPARSKIDKKFTWNSESVFKSTEAWEKEIKQIIEDISKIKMYQGRLAESPSVLLEAFGVAHDLVSRAQIAFMYARFSYAVDTTNQQAAGISSATSSRCRPWRASNWRLINGSSAVNP